MIESKETSGESIEILHKSSTMSKNTLWSEDDRKMMQKKEYEKTKILEAINRDDESTSEESPYKPLFYCVDCEFSYFLKIMDLEYFAGIYAKIFTLKECC